MKSGIFASLLVLAGLICLEGLAVYDMATADRSGRSPEAKAAQDTAEEATGPNLLRALPLESVCHGLNGDMIGEGYVAALQMYHVHCQVGHRFVSFKQTPHMGGAEIMQLAPYIPTIPKVSDRFEVTNDLGTVCEREFVNMVTLGVVATETDDRHASHDLTATRTEVAPIVVLDGLVLCYDYEEASAHFWEHRRGLWRHAPGIWPSFLPSHSILSSPELHQRVDTSRNYQP